uniref:Uncharacterized protein n=1 Tax=Megaselia scalaris TaxID=36166 RepID=T1GR25_MEGSC
MRIELGLLEYLPEREKLIGFSRHSASVVFAVTLVSFLVGAIFPLSPFISSEKKSSQLLRTNFCCYVIKLPSLEFSFLQTVSFQIDAFVLPTLQPPSLFLGCYSFLWRLLCKGLCQQQHFHIQMSRHPWGLRGICVRKTSLAAVFTTLKHFSHYLLISNSISGDGILNLR